MSNFFFKTVFALIISLWVLSPSQAMSALMGPEEQELFTLINQTRSGQGLSVLSFDSRLFEAARSHAVDMDTNGFVGHDSSDGTDAFTRLKNFGYPPGPFAELLSQGGNAQATLNLFLGSPLHATDLLNPIWLGMGVGYSADHGPSKWTVNMGSAPQHPSPFQVQPCCLVLGLRV